jgi:uncharacterized protein DUF3306
VTEPDDQFLKRWSRRKLETETAAPPPEAQPQLEADPEPLAESTEIEEHQALPPDLPDVDTLGKDSDYTGFMRDGVPEELKKLALRALWRSDPVLANLDGLNDYDEDYGAIARIGAEFMRKLALEEQKKDRAEPAATESPEEPESPSLETPESPSPENNDAVVADADTAAAAKPDDDGVVEPANDEDENENENENPGQPA